MEKQQQGYRKFLEEQLQWCKKQDHILKKIDSKLYEMKRIAEYALQHELTTEDTDELNSQLNKLRSEVHSLEKLLECKLVR